MHLAQSHRCASWVTPETGGQVDTDAACKSFEYAHWSVVPDSRRARFVAKEWLDVARDETVAQPISPPNAQPAQQPRAARLLGHEDGHAYELGTRVAGKRRLHGAREGDHVLSLGAQLV